MIFVPPTPPDAHSVSAHAVQVYIDANGQLGTIMPPVDLGGRVTVGPAQVQQLLREQQAMIAELRARLARLETLLSPATPVAR